MTGRGVAVTVVVWRRSKEASVLASGFVVAVGDGGDGGANWCMDERIERISGGCGIRERVVSGSTGAIAMQGERNLEGKERVCG